MNQEQKCSICLRSRTLLMDVLCPHQPCLDCAVSSYAEMTELRDHDANKYVCELCGVSTPLHSETREDLRKLATSKVKIPKCQKQTKAIPLNGDTSETKDLANPSFCSTHSQEVQTYFCYGCRKKICPECVIHGIHFGHQVKLIKKAVLQIKNTIKQVIRGMEVVLEDSEKKKEKIEDLLVYFHSRKMKDRAFVKAEMEKLMLCVKEKETEILQEIDRFYCDNAEVVRQEKEKMEHFMAEVNSKSNLLTQTFATNQLYILQEIQKLQLSKKNLQHLVQAQPRQDPRRYCFLYPEILQQQFRVLKEIIKKIHSSRRKERPFPDSTEEKKLS